MAYEKCSKCSCMMELKPKWFQCTGCKALFCPSCMDRFCLWCKKPTKDITASKPG